MYAGGGGGGGGAGAGAGAGAGGAGAGAGAGAEPPPELPEPPELEPEPPELPESAAGGFSVGFSVGFAVGVGVAVLDLVGAGLFVGVGFFSGAAASIAVCCDELIANAAPVAPTTSTPTAILAMVMRAFLLDHHLAVAASSSVMSIPP